MVIEYSHLQLEDFSQHTYLDTQSLKIAVLLPPRSNMLRSSLMTQVHQRFFCIRQLSELKDRAFDCLIAVGEDASAVSTFLGYYANEIKNGADLCFSNCCYGIDGQTGCFYAERNGENQPVHAVGISSALFKNLRLSGNTSVNELIAASKRAAAHPKLIPHMLLWFHRPVQVEDIFPEGMSRALLFTHEYSMTGAPLVLLGVVPELERQGYAIAAIGPKVDKLLPVYQQNGIISVVDADAVESSSMAYLAINCDFVLANTICEYDTISTLSRNQIPAIWWLHDAELGYPWLAPRLPQNLNKCIHIYSVSDYARSVFLKYCPNYTPDILMYALEDAAKGPTELFPVPHPGRKLFTTVGTLESRKGHDVLCRMIESLSEAERAQCLFLIVGRAVEKEAESIVNRLVEKYPQNVRYESFIPRSHIYSVFRQTDCILCPSKDDPLPTFVTEGWMLGVPCICSEHTGSAALIEDGINSFVYYDNSPEQLRSRVVSFLQMTPNQLAQMRHASRTVYETNFTMDRFNENIRSVIGAVKSNENA